jgi:hypothetical protein
MRSETRPCAYTPVVPNRWSAGQKWPARPQKVALVSQRIFLILALYPPNFLQLRKSGPRVLQLRKSGPQVIKDWEPPLYTVFHFLIFFTTTALINYHSFIISHLAVMVVNSDFNPLLVLLVQLCRCREKEYPPESYPAG